MAEAARRQFGEGPLSRAAALIYTLLVVELLFLLTAGPGLLPLVLLDRDASNLPLVAACALPLGPALSAALYALHHRGRDLADLRPAAAFRRGYRLNLRGVLWIWIPLLGWLTIVAVNLSHLADAAVPGWWAVPLVLVGIAVALCGSNALVITSLFAFRPVDVARLGVYFVFRRPGVALGTAAVAFVAATVVVLRSEAVLALVGSLFAALLLQTCRPMIADVRHDFTAEGTRGEQRP